MKDRIAVAGWSLTWFAGQADSNAGRSVLLLIFQGGATGKGAGALDIDKKSHPCLHGGDLVGKILAVERKAGFEAEAVPCAQSARQKAIGLADFEQSGPDFGSDFQVGKNLKSILPGVTRPGHQGVTALQLGANDSVALRQGGSGWHEFGKDGRSLRPLEGHAHRRSRRTGKARLGTFLLFQ